MKYGLNENIKSLRVAAGMNQVELAKALHVSKQCVSNWENDNVQPSVEMLVKIADLFRVSTDFLLGRVPAAVIDATGLSDAESAHLRALVADLLAK